MGKEIFRLILGILVLCIICFVVGIINNIPFNAIIGITIMGVAVVLFGVTIVPLLTNAFLKLKIRRRKLKPETKIHFKEEEELKDLYTLYSYPVSSFFDGDYTKYLFVMRNASLSDEARDSIASQEPFKDGLICFYEGTKWLKSMTCYDHGELRDNS